MKIGVVDFSDVWKTMSKEDFTKQYKVFEPITNVQVAVAYKKITGKDYVVKQDKAMTDTEKE